MTFGIIAQTDDKMTLASTTFFVKRKTNPANVEFLLSVNGKNSFKVTVSLETYTDAAKKPEYKLFRPALNECVIKLPLYMGANCCRLHYPEETMLTIDGSDIKFGIVIMVSRYGFYITGEYYTVFDNQDSEDSKEDDKQE